MNVSHKMPSKNISPLNQKFKQNNRKNSNYNNNIPPLPIKDFLTTFELNINKRIHKLPESERNKNNDKFLASKKNDKTQNNKTENNGIIFLPNNKQKTGIKKESMNNRRIFNNNTKNNIENINKSSEKISRIMRRNKQYNLNKNYENKLNIHNTTNYKKKINKNILTKKSSFSKITENNDTFNNDIVDNINTNNTNFINNDNINNKETNINNENEEVKQNLNELKDFSCASETTSQGKTVSTEIIQKTVVYSPNRDLYKKKVIMTHTLKKNNTSNTENEINIDHSTKEKLKKDFNACGTAINNEYKQKNTSLNLEELIIIESKLNHIIKSIENEQILSIKNLCLEWWNYYFNSEIKGNFEPFFNDIKTKNIIKNCNNLFLLTIILVYDLSLCPTNFSKYSHILQNILLLCHKNYLIICQYLLSKVSKEFLNNEYVQRLTEISNVKIIFKNGFFSVQIHQNSKIIFEYIKQIINYNMNDKESNKNNYKFNNEIFNVFLNLERLSLESINKLFLTKIIKLNNYEGSILFSELGDTKFSNDIYFLPKKQRKPLTLVLDLDETLMCFVYQTPQSGVSLYRPFLYEFLENILRFYEIVIFTAGTKDYARSILNTIEESKKLFDYCLYREHCRIINGDLVKDIRFLGRDLSKTVIVDNMPQNFKLQKENGICISSFWGEDDTDKALFELNNVLTDIAINMQKSNFTLDIRDELIKYKDFITKNVSMSQK